MSGVHPLNPLSHAGQLPGGGNAGPQGAQGNGFDPAGLQGGQGAQGPMVQLSGGGGRDGCLVCVGQKTGLVPKAELDKIKAESYSKIMAHEQAHASAAGAFGGGIHIDYDANGIAIGGHVPIAIPGLDPANPEQSLANYMKIRGAALAPGADASSQDHSVASLASSLMGQAQVAMQNKDKQQSGALQLPGNPPFGANPAAGKQGANGQPNSNGQPGGQQNGAPNGNATGLFQPPPIPGAAQSF